MSQDDVFGKRYRDPEKDKANKIANDRVFGKRFQTPEAPCSPEPVRSRQTPSGPQIFFTTIQNAGPTAQADVPVLLPFPCNSFFITSVKGGTENSSCFFHLTKLQKTYTLAAIAAQGTEPWISMNALPASGPMYRTVIRFKEKMMQFFLDIGFEGGAGPITIACVGDDAIQITGGLYT
jgi:hypothetical protein